jgi:transposase
MALGKRKDEQQEMWVATTDLPKSPGHVFYRKLNQVLAEAEFDRMAEKLCQPYYHDHIGRPGIPPGVYFRMLLVGYFEGLGSQRGIAWRCGDSLSLREFLGIPLTEDTPDHSSLTRVRDRLPLEVHAAVFQLVLKLAAEKGLLDGKTVAVDSTTLEANAAMKTIVRRDTGEDWNDYLRRLLQEQEGVENPTDEELRRFDRQRKDKRVSNEEWMSSTDADSRIAKMKDGRTHLAYKAEHVIDLKTELVLAVPIYHADVGDTDTLVDSVMEAQTNLSEAGLDVEIEEAVGDKGYHATDTLELADSLNIRT